MEEKNIYLITVEGEMHMRCSRWFETVDILSSENGKTVLIGEFTDSSLLYATINRIRDLGMKLIAIECKRKNDEVTI